MMSAHVAYGFIVLSLCFTSFAGYPVDFETVRLRRNNRENTKPSLIRASCIDNSSFCQTMLLIQTDIGDRVRLTLYSSSATETVLSQDLLQIYDGVSNSSANRITKNHRTESEDVLFYSSGHYMFILVNINVHYTTHLKQLNISLDSESVFLNHRIQILPCSLFKYRLSETRAQNWTLTFTRNMELPDRLEFSVWREYPVPVKRPDTSSFCITEFQFNDKKSLQISTRQYFSEATIVDGCVFEGIVLYLDEVSEATMIGPFCEVRKNFVESVLNKLLLTGHKFYLYLFAYTIPQVKSAMLLVEIMIEEISCKGIQLAAHLIPWLPASTPDGDSADVLVQSEYEYRIFLTGNTLFVNERCLVISIHNLKVDNPSKPFRIYSNESLQICFYSAMDIARSEEHISEICETVENGSLVGNFTWSLARIQKGEETVACPYTTCASWEELFSNGELLSDCGTIELLPVIDGSALSVPCTWKLYRGDMLDDKLHYFRIYIEICKGLQLKIAEFFKDPCYTSTAISRSDMPFDVNILLPALDYEYRTIGAFCSIVTFKFKHNILDREDVLIAHYSLEKYKLTKYNVSEDAIYVNRKRYTRFPRDADYNSSNEKCQNLSSPGRLVSINTRNELEQLKLALGTVWRGKKPEPMAVAIGLTDAAVWGDFRWADGNPLTLTDWYFSGSIEHTLPLSLRVGDAHIEASGHKFAKDIENQPAYEIKHRCVIMLIGNPHYSTNWVREDCETYDGIKINDYYFICESDDEVTTILSNKAAYRSPPTILPDMNNITHASTEDSHFPDQVQMSQMCRKNEDNWYILGASCVMLYHIDISPIGPTFHDSYLSADECGGRNGLFIVNDDNLELVINYLHALGHNPKYGAILVRLNQTTIGCLQTRGQITGELLVGKRWTLSTKCLRGEEHFVNAFEVNNKHPSCRDKHLNKHTTEIRGPGLLYRELVRTACFPQYALCMRPQGVEQHTHGCKHYQFTCNDGSCLSPDNVCDGYPDCLGGEDETACGKPDRSFVCNDNSIIPISTYCDFHNDCPDGDDESNCVHLTPCRSGNDRLCRNKQCIRQNQLCDGFFNCIDQSDEENCNSRKVCQSERAFFCSSDHCIPSVLANDTFADCPDASDSRFFKADIMKYASDTLKAWCTPYLRNLFQRTELCIYEDIYAANCRDASHLLHCEKFICPWGYFKCASSYCLPIRKVCDRKWDCIGGEDELNCSKYSCPGLLRSEKGRNCLSDSDVHSNRMESPSIQRGIKYRLTWKCPSACHCDGYVFNCSSDNIKDIPDIDPEARVINLADNSLEINNLTFFTFPYLAILNLNNNKLPLLPINMFKEQRNLLKLHLKGNNIKYIYPGTFNNLGSLEYLDISENMIDLINIGTFIGLSRVSVLNISRSNIESLQASTFRGLSRLKVLDLSFNRIDEIDVGTFADLPSLDSVNLAGNPLKMVSPEVFEEIKTAHLFTSSFRFCCFAKNADNCLPQKDTFSTCEDLMSNSFLQITIWITGLLSVSGNIIVIAWRIKSGIDSVDVVFIFNLAISDLFIGIYLVVLASFDLTYRGEYKIHDASWREGAVCKVIGFLATLSSQMSLLLLVCITTDRFWKIVYPLSPRVLSRRRAWLVCATGWIITVLICALPFSAFKYFGDFYGRNSVCIPYNFSARQTSGWQYALGVFIVPDTVACIYMSVAYIIMFRCIRQSQKRTTTQCNDSEIKMARKMFRIVITDLICWMPIIISSLRAYMGYTLNDDTVAFLAVLVLPINGALNPYLYTLPTFRRRRTNT